MISCNQIDLLSKPVYVTQKWRCPCWHLRTINRSIHISPANRFINSPHLLWMCVFFPERQAKSTIDRGPGEAHKLVRKRFVNRPLFGMMRWGRLNQTFRDWPRYSELRISNQKKRDVHKISARDSGAGNGCANFMGAWHFFASFCWKTPMPIKSSF